MAARIAELGGELLARQTEAYGCVIRANNIRADQ